MKKMLAVVISMGQHTLQKSPSRRFHGGIDRRLHAMARSYGCCRNNWKGGLRG